MAVRASGFRPERGGPGTRTLKLSDPFGATLCLSLNLCTAPCGSSISPSGTGEYPPVSPSGVIEEGPRTAVRVTRRKVRLRRHLTSE